MKQVDGNAALATEDNWDSFWNRNQNSRSTKVSWSKRRIMSILSRYLEPGSVVLDAGCGSGFFSKFFIDQGAKTYTLDYSADALAIAERLTDGRAEAYLKEDLFSQDFVNSYAGSFDLIFTDGLLEHFSLDQQRQLIANFTALKRDSGVIVTFVPHLYSWWTVVRPILMPEIDEVPFTTERLLDVHGSLDILEQGGINVLPIGLSPEGLGPKCGMLLYCIAR